MPGLSPRASSSNTCYRLSVELFVFCFQECSLSVPCSTPTSTGLRSLTAITSERKAALVTYLFIQLCLDTSLCVSPSFCKRSIPSMCVFVPIPSALSRVRSSIDMAIPGTGRERGLVLPLASLGRTWGPEMWLESSYLGLRHEDGAKL